MKKLGKKILTGAFILLFVFLIKVPNLKAASCRIGVSAPSSAVVGSTFRVTVTVSGSAAIGSWEYTLGYDSSKVRLNSGQLHIVDYGNGSKTSASYTYSFTALKSGAATFKPTNASILDYASTNECLSGTGSATVTMKTQAEIEESYSRNNNLSSLTVEGAELTPAFNKDTLEYSATLPVDTTKAKINATVEDRTAIVSGVGEIDVVDGMNKVEVKVTAQHGEVKTYVINLTVQELDPIKVTIDGKNYTIVRKKGQVENIPSGFGETSIKIEEQDIAAYKSEAAKLTLVALKDEEGKVGLFIYDEVNKGFKAFNLVKGNLMNLIILDYSDKNLPYDFESVTFDCNGIKTKGYKFKDVQDSNYYVVYAKNLDNGNEEFYLYDKKESTFQRYYSDLVDTKNKQIKEVLYVAAGSLGLLVLIILIKLLSKIFTSKKRKIRKYEKKLAKLKGNISFEEEQDDFYDLDKLDDKPIIKKVEEDEYVVPRKSRKEKLREIREAKERLDRTKSFKRVSLDDDDDE